MTVKAVTKLNFPVGEEGWDEGKRILVWSCSSVCEIDSIPVSLLPQS